MEERADFTVVIEGDEVETACAGHFQNFAEGKGVFEQDGPYDEEAVEDKENAGEGEFWF